jgi:hypothetical protein
MRDLCNRTSFRHDISYRTFTSQLTSLRCSVAIGAIGWQNSASNDAPHKSKLTGGKKRKAANGLGCAPEGHVWG